jgi:hypothetical protein
MFDLKIVFAIWQMIEQKQKFISLTKFVMCYSVLYYLMLLCQVLILNIKMILTC